MSNLSQSGVWVELDERDLSCIRWAVPIIRGAEENFGEQAGTREGEAMSDVLAAIVARAELAPPEPPVGACGQSTSRGRCAGCCACEPGDWFHVPLCDGDGNLLETPSRGRSDA